MGLVHPCYPGSLGGKRGQTRRSPGQGPSGVGVLQGEKGRGKREFGLMGGTRGRIQLFKIVKGGGKIWAIFLSKKGLTDLAILGHKPTLRGGIKGQFRLNDEWGGDLNKGKIKNPKEKRSSA